MTNKKYEHLGRAVAAEAQIEAESTMLDGLRDELYRHLAVHRADLVAQERDEARRKLGALTLCVGFLKDYDARHPKKSLETFRVSVKKCIADNHIVLTEGGMAK